MLPSSVCPQHRDRAGVERDGPAAGIRFRVILGRRPTQDYQLRGDGELRAVQVDVEPPEIAGLASAHPDVGHPMEQHVQTVRLGLIQEGVKLREGPHDDRAQWHRVGLQLR